MAAVWVSAFWSGFQPTVARCIQVFGAAVLRSSPFRRREDAVEFWGQARVLRYLCGLGVFTVSAAATVVIGCPWTTSAGVVLGSTIVTCGALAVLTELRLRRSRRAGGWG